MNLYDWEKGVGDLSAAASSLKEESYLLPGDTARGVAWGRLPSLAGLELAEGEEGKGW